MVPADEMEFFAEKVKSLQVEPVHPSGGVPELRKLKRFLWLRQSVGWWSDGGPLVVLRQDQSNCAALATRARGATLHFFRGGFSVEKFQYMYNLYSRVSKPKDQPLASAFLGESIERRSKAQLFDRCNSKKAKWVPRWVPEKSQGSGLERISHTAAK